MIKIEHWEPREKMMKPYIGANIVAVSGNDGQIFYRNLGRLSANGDGMYLIVCRSDEKTEHDARTPLSKIAVKDGEELFSTM